MAVSPTTGTASSSSGPTSVSGLASGIQYNNIIDAMIQADRASTAVIETRKATFQGRLDAVRSLNSKMLSVQLDLASLNNKTLFNGKSAISSNTSAITSTASSSAAAGTYNFEVLAVAKASQLATAGSASSSAGLGAGTISLQLGTAGATTINIDDSSSSLDGIARAINAAGVGVNASVVNDGSSGTPYRLMLTSKDTGTANAITVSGTGGMGTLFTGSTVLQAGSDAQIRLGSGANALTLTKSSNTFPDVVQGLTLTANAVGSSTVTVGNQSGDVSTAVKNFVDSYNAVAQYMTDNASFNSTNSKAGVLFGESDVRTQFNSLTQTILGSVPGLPLTMSTMTAVGIDYDRTTGKLTLDQTKLTDAVNADPQAVGKLFTNSGTSSVPGIDFALLTDKTKTSTPFTVQVTQAADKAKATGVSDLAASTVISSANHTLKVEVNGRDYEATIADGSYTKDQLAARVQAALDQAITVPADKISVSSSGNRLTLTGTGYGTASTIQVDGTSSANASLYLPTNKLYGTDAAGFINGVAATGAGQTLSGADGSDAEGLRLIITATAPIASATMTIRKGIGPLAADKVKSMTESISGSLTGKAAALQTTIDNLTKTITDTDARLATRRQRYQLQFQAMEKSISDSNSMGSYLTSQIKGFENAAANK